MNRPLRSLALVGAIAMALPVACTAQPPTTPIAPPPAATPAPPLVSGLPDFTGLVQRVGPAVVNIRAEITAGRQYDFVVRKSDIDRFDRVSGRRTDGGAR